jgi:hypothetical protein
VCCGAYLNKVLKYSINIIKKQKQAQCDSLEIKLLMVQKISCNNTSDHSSNYVSSQKTMDLRVFLTYIKDV